MEEEHGKIYGSSQRYVLAELDDSYVIWDLRDPGDEPVETYPATEEGFERANERFKTLVRLDRRDRASLVIVLRWVVVVGVVVWAISGVIWRIDYYKTTEFPIGGFSGRIRYAQMMEGIAYDVWLGALAILVLTLVFDRLKDREHTSPPRPDALPSSRFDRDLPG